MATEGEQAEPTAPSRDLSTSGVADVAKRFFESRVSRYNKSEPMSRDWKEQMLAGHPNHPLKYLASRKKEDLWERGMDLLLMPVYEALEAAEDTQGWQEAFLANIDERYGRKLSSFETQAIMDYLDYLNLPRTQALIVGVDAPDGSVAVETPEVPDPELGPIDALIREINADFSNGGTDISLGVERKILAAALNEAEAKFIREYIEHKRLSGDEKKEPGRHQQ